MIIMAASGISRAQENKHIRQEALREQLSTQGHIQHVVDIATKLMDLDTALDNLQVTRLKTASDIKLKLIDKYLPTEKPTQITGSGEEGAVIFSWLK